MPAWTLYMDESGSAGDREGHYVLGCLAGGEEAIARLTDRLYYLKRGMATGMDPDSWEVHANKIMSGYSPIRTRTERKKLDAFEAFVDTICESDVVLLGASIVNELVHRNDKDASTRYTLTFILERFELLLRSHDPETNGRIVSDMMRHGTSDKINRVFASMAHGHNTISDMKTGRITGIQYVSSLSNPMVQLADVIAYVIGKHVEGDARFAAMFEKLMAKMWRGGEWHGWKMFGAKTGQRRS